MNRTKEILRQKLSLQRSHREVARSLNVSAGVVGAVCARTKKAGLTDWSEVEAMGDEHLEHRLYGRKVESSRPLPDWGYIHTERSKPGVTLQLLHLEYLEQHPYGYQYTRFCDFYRDWLDLRRLSMRQVHKAGEKMFIDFAGKRPHVVDRETGEVTQVELFVAVLGAVATPTSKPSPGSRLRSGYGPTRTRWSTSAVRRRSTCPTTSEAR